MPGDNLLQLGNLVGTGNLRIRYSLHGKFNAADHGDIDLDGLHVCYMNKQLS